MFRTGTVKHAHTDHCFSVNAAGLFDYQDYKEKYSSIKRSYIQLRLYTVAAEIPGKAGESAHIS